MMKLRIALAASLLLWASPVLAQSGASFDAPASTQEADADCPGMMGGGMGAGMMGQGMMRGSGWGVRHGMMGPGPVMSGRRLSAFVAGQLAYLKADLEITAAQEPQWKGYADAVTDSAKAMIGQSQRMKPDEDETLHDRLVRRQQMMTAHREAFNKTAAALDALYGVLTPEQKEIADDLTIGPMGILLGM